MYILKYTTEEMSKKFEESGCKLLGKYTGCMDKMKYQCSCGEISHITWNNFSKGKRCGHCTKWGLKKKRSLEQVKEIFRERGCEFLDDEFKGVDFKCNYICKCGRKAKIFFGAFYYQKQYCHYCAVDARRGSKNSSWRPDREQLAQDKLFRAKCYHALSYTLKATNKKKVGRTSDMLGYGPKELQKYITNHPNWNNVKDKNWCIDHIFPINAFLEHDVTDLKLINALENLQPITQKENNQKHAKYDKKEFKKWLKLKGVLTEVH